MLFALIVENVKIIKRGIIVNITKFTEIKNFFNNLWSSKDYEMNFFIEYNSINAIVEYLNDGYILNEEQNHKLKKVLVANNTYNSNMEELVQTNLPEKYIFHVLAEPQNNIFVNKEELNKMPYVKEWLIKQSDTKIAKVLVSNWIENFQYLLENKGSRDEIRNEITQLEKISEYFSYLPNGDKNNLIDFISNKLPKYSSTVLNRTQLEIQPELNNLIRLINQSMNKKVIEEKSISNLLKTLCNQDEGEVLTALENVHQQYEVLLVEFNDMDKMKKTALLNLYNKHLISGINQYLDIKKEIRIKLVKDKTAKEMVLENIQCVKEVFNNHLQLLNEEKLMKLSAKTEYFSQIKKQW